MTDFSKKAVDLSKESASQASFLPERFW